MGKRKAKRKQVVRKRPVLDTQFDCLFCNHEKSITVKMIHETKVGELKCSICGANYQSAINSLSHPIDVYSDWIDACEELNPGAL
ncbi:Elf1-domain-containing protein [Neocallimastix lanati (nom. inval.)]|uniref:Transcription elongation factor 1 homolog n=1 Tax=Neocallimastix californiae TaxID=1754190 RepID=A0A1Y2CGU6_9FUNG|nr:Elf1-domain-containing protein [Neocallimastix sp. JGI-2020a]ORY46268.1 Elf1-domain-containing protein [Neocallimastix californiae]|eukprot:ORY46268.1 Elf1-domain-containing protein [Neocallimastix californiae]